MNKYKYKFILEYNLKHNKIFDIKELEKYDNKLFDQYIIENYKDYILELCIKYYLPNNLNSNIYLFLEYLKSKNKFDGIISQFNLLEIRKQFELKSCMNLIFDVITYVPSCLKNDYSFLTYTINYERFDLINEFNISIYDNNFLINYNGNRRKLLEFMINNNINGFINNDLRKIIFSEFLKYDLINKNNIGIILKKYAPYDRFNPEDFEFISEKIISLFLNTKEIENLYLLISFIPYKYQTKKMLKHYVLCLHLNNFKSYYDYYFELRKIFYLALFDDDVLRYIERMKNRSRKNNLFTAKSYFNNLSSRLRHDDRSYAIYTDTSTMKKIK